MAKDARFEEMKKIAIKIVICNSKKKAKEAAAWLSADMEAQTYKTTRPVRPNIFGLEDIYNKSFVIGNLGQIAQHILFLLMYEAEKKKCTKPIKIKL